MEVESLSEQQIFDKLCKLASDSKAKTTAALAEQQRMAQEQHRVLLNEIRDIRAGIRNVRLRMERDDPRPSTASTAASPPSPKRDTAVVPPASSTARSTASPRVWSSAAPITDPSSKHDTPVDDLSPGARRLYDLIVRSSASPTSAASSRVPSSGIHAPKSAPGSAPAATSTDMATLHSPSPFICLPAAVSDTGTSTSTAKTDNAYKLFDRMPQLPEWSSDCTLSIVVTHTRSPVSEKMIRPILAPYGVKRLVVNPRATTRNGFHHGKAIVELRSRDEAVWARASLHKCLLDKCCYLDVRFALPCELASMTASTEVTSTITPTACVLSEDIPHIEVVPEAISTKLGEAPIHTDDLVAIAAAPTDVSAMVDENSESNDDDSDTAQLVIFSPAYDEITSSVASSVTDLLESGFVSNVSSQNVSSDLLEPICSDSMERNDTNNMLPPLSNFNFRHELLVKSDSLCSDADAQTSQGDQGLLDTEVVQFTAGNGVVPTLKQLVLSQIKFGEVQMQFPGPLHQAPVYWSFLCSSEFPWFLPYDSCSSLQSEESSTMNWFQFGSAGKVQMYNYGAAQIQWEIAWSNTTQVYSIHYGMHLYLTLESNIVISYLEIEIHELHLHWDPGGRTRHCLGVKSRFRGIAVSRFITYDYDSKTFLASLNGRAEVQHILQVSLLHCTERNRYPPPLSKCITVSMGNIPSSHVILNSLCAANVWRYLNKRNSVEEPKPPWSHLATPSPTSASWSNVRAVFAPLLIIGILFQWSPLLLLICLIHVLFRQWFWGLVCAVQRYKSTDPCTFLAFLDEIGAPIATEGATYVGSQQLEWKIPWYFCPCHAISSSSCWLRRQPVDGHWTFKYLR